MFTIFAKISVLDVWEGSEYASKLASKVEDVSFLKKPNEFQNSWSKMLQNRNIS